MHLRRSLARTLAFGCLVAVALASPKPVRAQSTAPADSWPQFRGSAQLTGASASSVPDDLQVLWSYQADDVIDSSAAIVDGVVYIGIGNGDLLALNLDDGSLRWKYSSPNLIGESSATVGRDTVYIGDLGGLVHAVNIADGTARWTFETTSEIKSSPVLVDDLLLVGSYDGFLYGLDADTGQERWKAETEGPVHATPAVQNGLAFIAGCDERFRAIRIQDGTQAFAVTSGAYTGASPVLAGDRAYFGTFNYEVLSVDLDAHDIAWRYSDPDRAFPFYSSGALSDGRIVVGGRDKIIRSLDSSTGRALWTFPTRARVDSSPAVAGGRVYIGSNDGHLYVLDLDTGTKHWEFDTGAGITASPAIASGRVVIGTQDGVIYAFG